jgi:hypothetical protein
MKFITIGADPEFFVLDPKGKPYPATLFANGSKENPILIEELGNGFYEQRDNLSFEGNIPPANCRGDFRINMTFLRSYFEHKVAKFGYSLSPNGVEYFERRYLHTPEGMEFGCSSVVSSWDSTSNRIQSRPTPNLAKVKYRVAGFHIHIGVSTASHAFKEHNTLAVVIGRLFDLFLTMPSQILKPEPERIHSYGKYGMIRVKEYGVECRTLSSYFTQTDQLGWVWDQLMKLEEFMTITNHEDLLKIATQAYYVGDTNDSISRVFRGIFEQFTNKEVLLKFKETKEIYENKKYEAYKEAGRRNSAYTANAFTYTYGNKI